MSSCELNLGDQYMYVCMYTTELYNIWRKHAPPSLKPKTWRGLVPIGPNDWSPLQVVTTDPKCDTKLATMSFAPLIWLKIFFTRWPQKSNNLKILDFLKNIFILYPQRGGKRYFSLRVKARICYKCWRILLSGMCHATCICTLRIGLVFTESRRCL